MPKESSIEKIKIEHKKEPKPKTKILVLEDENAEVARKALIGLGMEVKVVQTLEELKGLTKEFEPDLVILDINVPEKKGEKPINQAKKSKEIVKEKFGDVPVFYYTSYHHGSSLEGGMGITPQEAVEMRIILKGDEEIKGIAPNLPSELMDVADKSKEENWKKIFLLMPYFSGFETFKVIQAFPEALRQEALEILKKDNPMLVGSIERRLKWEEEKSKLK